VSLAKKRLKVRCPTCGKKVLWEECPDRPFCSERCKMIDLGEWLSEGYRISTPLNDESASQSPKEEAGS
jgi:hypothetical protein